MESDNRYQRWLNKKRKNQNIDLERYKEFIKGKHEIVEFYHEKFDILNILEKYITNKNYAKQVFKASIQAKGVLLLWKNDNHDFYLSSFWSKKNRKKKNIIAIMIPDSYDQQRFLREQTLESLKHQSLKINKEEIRQIENSLNNVADTKQTTFKTVKIPKSVNIKNIGKSKKQNKKTKNTNNDTSEKLALIEELKRIEKEGYSPVKRFDYCYLNDYDINELRYEFARIKYHLEKEKKLQEKKYNAEKKELLKKLEFMEAHGFKVKKFTKDASLLEINNELETNPEVNRFYIWQILHGVADIFSHIIFKRYSNVYENAKK